ncbi:MAG TPA: hypothetical protein PLA50_04410, partial [Bacteroidia bacterium]|nr:hypothetical protein [Bacteroidia bacterium]
IIAHHTICTSYIYEMASNKLTQACPDKEFTKTTESFLRSVMTIDAGREKEYLETANQNADAFFEQLTNSTNKLREEIRNGSPSFTGGEWLDTAKASHEILNRAARHTKEIVESLEQSEYKNDLTKLNQLIRSKGKETITTMYGLMKKSQPAPDADKATPGDTEKTSDPAPAPAKAPE